MKPRIYLQAGLFAEGRNDYDFLLPLLGRLLADLLAEHWPGRSTELPDVWALDAPGKRREDRIAEVIQRNSEGCQLFVVHADADGDAGLARKERVEPGVRRGLAGVSLPVAASACIPIEMTEAWMLADVAPWRLLGCKDPEMPRDPEGIRYPKPVVKALQQPGRRGRLPDVAASVGANVSLAALRRLAGFRAFEAELLRAMQDVVAASERGA